MRLNEAPTGNFFVLGGESRGITISWLDRHSFLVGSTNTSFTLQGVYRFNVAQLG